LKVNQHKSMQQQQNPVNAPILTYTVWSNSHVVFTLIIIVMKGLGSLLSATQNLVEKLLALAEDFTVHCNLYCIGLYTAKLRLIYKSAVNDLMKIWVCVYVPLTSPFNYLIILKNKKSQDVLIYITPHTCHKCTGYKVINLANHLTTRQL
jgi:hypothetical protein